MRDIEALCSRAVIINSGTLVYDGALSDINHRMGDKRLLTLSFSSPVENGKLSVFGRVRENKDLTAVLETRRSGSRKRHRRCFPCFRWMILL